MPPLDQPASPPRADGVASDGRPSSRKVAPPPPMQVVTKGWWVLRDEQASVAELEQADRPRRA